MNVAMPTTSPDGSADVITRRTGAERHDIALVLGSGWASAADLVGDTIAEIPNTDVPGFHPAAVPGHHGTIRSVRVSGHDARVLVFGTRTHFYEGRGVRAVVHGPDLAVGVGLLVLAADARGLWSLAVGATLALLGWQLLRPRE